MLSYELSSRALSDVGGTVLGSVSFKFYRIPKFTIT